MLAGAIARLVKTPAARPALVAAGLASDRGAVARATYELMTIDLRPELRRITAPVTIVHAYDSVYGVPSATIDALYRTAYSARTGAYFGGSTTATTSSCSTSRLVSPKRWTPF